MVQRTVKLLMTLVVALLLTTGCQKNGIDENNAEEVAIETGNQTDSEGDLTKGYMEDGIYKNPYFGLEIALPEGWIELTQEQQESLMEAGQDIVKDKDVEINLEDMAIINMFAFFKYPLEEQKSVNPNIVASAEKLDPESDIDSATGYLEVTKTLMLSMGVPLVFNEDIQEVQLNGLTYAKLSARIETDMATISQVYYTRVVGGYAVNIIGTYTQADGKDVIETLFE